MTLTFANSLLARLAFFGCISVGTPAVVDTVQPAASPQVMQFIQVIIKFSDPSLDPARQSYLDELTRDIGATLVYIRPLSGDTHVLRIEAAMDTDQFQRVVVTLMKRVEVEYVERDRRMFRTLHD